MRYILILDSTIAIISSAHERTQENRKQIDLSPHNLVFDFLPTTWDEGLPLGNGQIAALVWQNNDQLRLSLDHVNL